MTALTASRPVPSLLLSLRRAGWGDLDGDDLRGVRGALEGLAALLPHASGEGLVTVAQVADAAGYSPRWTRRSMRILEEIGVIEWTRGGVRAGQPVPSHVRIVKTVLVTLILAARLVHEAAQVARATATRARIAAARLWWCGPRRRWSAHAALSADPHPQGGGSGPRSGVRGAPPTPGGPMTPTSDRMARLLTPAICEEHGSVAGLLADGRPRCPGCRRRAAQAARAAAAMPAPRPADDWRMRQAGDDTLWED